MQIIADFLHDQYHSTGRVRIKTHFVPYHGTGWFPSTLPAKRNVFMMNYVMAGGAPRKHRIPPWFTYEGHAGGFNLSGLLRQEGLSIGRRHLSHPDDAHGHRGGESQALRQPGTSGT